MARKSTVLQSVYETKWTQAARDAYYQEHPERFADRKNKKFPIKDRSDVGDAWGLAGHGEDPNAVRHAIISIAKSMGFTDALPDTAKDFAKGKEGAEQASPPTSESVSLQPAMGSSSSPARPRERIATVRFRWITDGARSVNGRIYPRETVDRLIASGQRKLADSNELPITCFLSHKDADSDHTPALIGKATRIWREGADGIALIDFADTTQSRNALGLIVGKYICTESLRCKNAELRTDPRYDVPLVLGDGIELEGIDLTNYPGLEQVARIQQVHLAESAGGNASLTETFAIAPTALLIQHQTPANEQKGQHMSKPLNEAVPPGGNTVGGYSPTSGEAPYMTSDNPTDSYGQRMYQAPAMTSGPMQGMDSPGYAVDLREAHDRIAMVQNRTCAPSRESARGQAVLKSMSESERTQLAEAGRSLSNKNDGHLDRAHDALAHHMSMNCEGKNNKMGAAQPANDGMQDGDSDDHESRKPRPALKESKTMTPEEAAALLESAGYKIEKPKTEAEILKETIASMQAEQARQREEQAKQLEEMKALITQSQQVAPQRRSQVLGANIGEPATTGRYQPMHGRHLQEQINKLDWSALTDRTAPLPDTIPLDLLMREMEQYYAVLYDNRYGILTAVQ